jgi:hypothetical protein
MRLSRAAFAVMIKFSEFFDDFQVIVDEVEMMWDQLEGDDERELKIKDHMKGLTHYEHIAKRWESSSKMRQWINEKKKNLIERIKKEVELEYIRKKEEEKKTQPSKVGVSKEESKIQDGDEQIDTSASKAEGEAKVDAQGLTEEDRVTIDDLTDARFNTEL